MKMKKPAPADWLAGVTRDSTIESSASTGPCGPILPCQRTTARTQAGTTTGGVEKHVEGANHDCNVAGINFIVKFFLPKPTLFMN
jgi:hypothetical protein